MPSSGSITSPLPESRNVDFASATISSASRWRSERSVRHSLASSTAAARQIAVIFLQLVFEAREKRKRVGRAAGKSGEDLVVEKAARLFRVVLDHAFAHGDLAVGGEHDFVVLADAQNRGAVHLLAFLRRSHQAIILRSEHDELIRREASRKY